MPTKSGHEHGGARRGEAEEADHCGRERSDGLTTELAERTDGEMSTVPVQRGEERTPETREEEEKAKAQMSQNERLETNCKEHGRRRTVARPKGRIRVWTGKNRNRENDVKGDGTKSRRPNEPSKSHLGRRRCHRFRNGVLGELDVFDGDKRLKVIAKA